MGKRVVIRPHEYYDSVRLMQVSEMLRREAAVQEAILMMATPNNKKLLEVAGLLTQEAQDAVSDDLIIAIVAADEFSADTVLEKAVQHLSKGSARASAYSHRTLDSALQVLPEARLALISVPGEYAALEARRALERGLHVMLFSDNVSLDDELALKQLASDRKVLMMGPDCGTAIINGIGVGFANAVHRGSIGIVGASGTGIQEISVLLHRLNCGISHALGTGGRDLASAVGGLSMLAGLEMLDSDADTHTIILTSKPPDERVARKIITRASMCSKPVIVNFLGGDSSAIESAGLINAETLEDAALKAAELAGCGTDPSDFSLISDHELCAIAEREATKFAPGQAYLRGLFSGGTLCYEAMLVLRKSVGAIYSNVPLEARYKLSDPWESYKHTVVDLGDDQFTQGRAHPMIDPTLRNERIIQDGQDRSVAVLLLDLVLGYGSHPNPAVSLAKAIEQGRIAAQSEGRHLCAIASICGTDMDGQLLAEQQDTLVRAGVLVATSNAQAARLAAAVIESLERRAR